MIRWRSIIITCDITLHATGDPLPHSMCSGSPCVALHGAPGGSPRPPQVATQVGGDERLHVPRGTGHDVLVSHRTCGRRCSDGRIRQWRRGCGCPLCGCTNKSSEQPSRGSPSLGVTQQNQHEHRHRPEKSLES